MSRSIQVLLAAALLLISGALHAHLMNMTEVRAEIDDGLQVNIDLEMDLLAEFGSPQGYYEFSQTDPELLLQNYQALFDRLIDSIQVSPQALDSAPISLRLMSVTTPRESRLADFENDFDWPMTEIQLQGQIPAAQAALPIRIQFRPSFVFEEPIALTMYSSLTEKSKSRWLVTGQTGPKFAISTDAEQLVREQKNSLFTWADLGTRISALGNYALFGFRHILPDGWDHLLFVLMIYIATRTRLQLLGQISIFTLAHSLTLILASYKVVEFPSLAVEVLITLSIFVLAAKNVLVERKRSRQLYSERPSKARLSAISVFLFGLLHGLGFASSLNALDLPSGDFLASLISFNIGVELGQICFIVLVAAIIGRFKRKSFYQDRIAIPLSAVSAAIALLWVGFLIF